MVHPSKLNKIWLILGVLFILMGGYNLVVHHYIGSLLTIAIGALVVYSSVYQMGGWNAAFHETGLSKLFAKKKKVTGIKKNGRHWH